MAWITPASTVMQKAIWALLSRSLLRIRLFWHRRACNIGLIDELLAPDYVNHSPGMPDQPTGPEGSKQ